MRAATEQKVDRLLDRSIYYRYILNHLFIYWMWMYNVCMYNVYLHYVGTYRKVYEIFLKKKKHSPFCRVCNFNLQYTSMIRKDILSIDSFEFTSICWAGKIWYCMEINQSIEIIKYYYVARNKYDVYTLLYEFYVCIDYTRAGQTWHFTPTNKIGDVGISYFKYNTKTILFKYVKGCALIGMYNILKHVAI